MDNEILESEQQVDKVVDETSEQPVIEKINLTEIETLKNEDEIFDFLNKAIDNEKLQKLSDEFLEENPEYKLPLIPMYEFVRMIKKEATINEIADTYNISLFDLKRLFDMHKENGDFE